MTWLFRLLLFLVLLTVLRILLAKLFAPLLGAGRSRSRMRASRPYPAAAGQTVKDPYCGMYVAMDLALPARWKGETVYFCSEKCRAEFMRTR